MTKCLMELMAESRRGHTN